MTSPLHILRMTAGLFLLAAALGGAAPALAQTEGPAILIVGDSISAGLGLPADTGWVTLLQQRLVTEHYGYRVINASISGDTTAGGRARLGALLVKYRPEVTVLELGANDGLRGGSLDAMRANLDAMTAAAQQVGSKVLLIGMQLPPNYGPNYVQTFNATFGDVAKARKASLVPFLFAGFAMDETLFQPDRIHPAIAAQPLMLDTVWPYLRPLLRATKKAA